MRKSKVHARAVKRIMRPEVSYCLECQRRLPRCVTISQRTVVTLSHVIELVHCGYRCPAPDCPGRKHLYRCAQADALALPGFTFGLDIVILVGQLRLREHKTVDEIHRLLTERLAPLGQTLSRREILFLFEAYSALLRAGTEVRENKGLLLSIDGIQPDRGNETIYLVRDVFTGRIVTAENVTESTKERLKEVLAPVVALGLPVVGVISDGQSTQLQAVAELWPGIAHQICQFHAQLRRAVDFCPGPAHQDRDARQITAKNPRISSKYPQTHERSQSHEASQRGRTGSIGSAGGICGDGRSKFKRRESRPFRLWRTGYARGLDPHSNELRAARKKGAAVNQTCEKRRVSAQDHGAFI